MVCTGGADRRVSVALTLVAAVVLTLAGCQSQPHERTTVRVATFQVVGCLPYFIAVHQRLFDEQNLAVEAVEFTNSNDAVSAMLAGKVDIIPAISLVPIVNLEIRQPNTVRLFSHSRATPERASDSIVVTQSASLKSVHDLAGRRVGVFPGTTASRMLTAFLQKNGIATEGIQFLPLAPGLQLSALSTGAVDAVYGYEPTTTAARLSGEFRTLYGSVYASLANPSVLGGAVVSRAFESRDPAAAARAIGVFDDAVRYMRDHSVEVRTLLPQFLKLSPEVAEAVTIVESGLSNENSLLDLGRMVDLLFEIGEIPEKIEPRRLVELAS